MKRIALSFLFIAVLIACAGAGKKPQTNEMPLSEELLPMKVGNSWTYVYTGLPREPQTLEFRISESKKVQGRTYYHFTNWFTLTPEKDSAGVWLAWHNHAIYRLVDDSPEEVIGKKVKDAAFQHSSDRIETPAGTFQPDLTFQTCLHCADAGSTLYFVKGKGVVGAFFSAIWGSASYKLVEAKLQ